MTSTTKCFKGSWRLALFGIVCLNLLASTYFLSVVTNFDGTYVVSDGIKTMAIARDLGLVSGGFPLTSSESMERTTRNSTAVICLIAKSEEAYIDEFVDYHFGLGFSKVYVYDNSEENDLQQWGDTKNKALPSSMHSVDVKHFPQQSPQSHAYQDCGRRAHAEGQTYAAFIDGDEFIVLHQHTHVIDLLEDYCNRDGQGALVLHWRVMGTGGQEVYSPQPLTKRFRYATSVEPLDTVKTIARLEHIDLTQLPHAHYPHMKAGYQRRSTAGKVSNDHRAPLSQNSADVAVLYHYSYKSFREYLFKRSFRGRATVNSTDPSHAILTKQAKQKRIPIGVVRDDTAWEAMKKVLPRYSFFDELFPDAALHDPLAPTEVRDSTPETTPAETTTETKTQQKCAINLHGAARSFAHMALPSIVTNIIHPNSKYGCDYFVHFHNIGFENKSRSGFGGALDPTEVYQLQDAVLRETPNAVVAFSNSTEEQIRTVRAELIEKIKTEKDSEGIYLYQPTDPQDVMYNFETTTNIVKMWHNLESVWKLMEQNEQKANAQYDQVAMVRLDSFYLTPIDVFHYDTTINADEKNWDKTAVIPGFARFPVNDRFVYGPRAVVQSWANRFELIDHHIQHARAQHKLIGLHSEHFLHKTVFPLLGDRGYTIAVDDGMCFLRTRADNVVWAEDCKDHGGGLKDAPEWMGDVAQIQEKLEEVVGRKCSTVDQFNTRKQLQCSM